MKLTNASGGPLDLLQTNEFYGLASESALHRTFLSIVCLARLDPLEQLAFDPVTFSRLQGISAGLLQLLLQGQVATNGC